MTLFITLLFVITMGLLIFNYSRAGVIALWCTFGMFLITTLGILSTVLLKDLEKPYLTLSQPIWKKNNVIVVLGGGTVETSSENRVTPAILAYGRIHEAVRLYFSCKKTQALCKLMISGGDPQVIGKAEALVYRDELNAIGIKNTDIILEAHSNNTYQNAEFSSAILKLNHFDNILLVTSGFHMKRALSYFSHFGIDAIPAVSDYLSARISFIPKGYNVVLTDLAIHEYIGILRFDVYNYFGWNAKPAQA